MATSALPLTLFWPSTAPDAAAPSGFGALSTGFFTAAFSMFVDKLHINTKNKTLYVLLVSAVLTQR